VTKESSIKKKQRKQTCRKDKPRGRRPKKQAAEDANASCAGCGEKYLKSGGKWLQCSMPRCRLWYELSCTGLQESEEQICVWTVWINVIVVYYKTNMLLLLQCLIKYFCSRSVHFNILFNYICYWTQSCDLLQSNFVPSSGVAKSHWLVFEGPGISRRAAKFALGHRILKFPRNFAEAENWTVVSTIVGLTR